MFIFCRECVKWLNEREKEKEQKSFIKIETKSLLRNPVIHCSVSVNTPLLNFFCISVCSLFSLILSILQSFNMK